MIGYGGGESASIESSIPGFDSELGEHIEVAVHHPVGESVNRSASDVSRLQIRRVRSRGLARRRSILRLDDTRHPLGIPEPPELQVRILEVIECMEVAVRPGLAGALHTGF